MNLTLETTGFAEQRNDRRTATLVNRLAGWARAAASATLRAARRHVQSPEDISPHRLEEWTSIGLVNSGHFS